jgi:uncharacterized repeat protein (TIGR03803 family)
MRTTIMISWAACLACVAAPVNLRAQTPTTLFNFDGADGQFPSSRLLQATDGNLYGTTYGGGANSSGTVFQIRLNGALKTLHSFCAQSGCADGGQPVAALVQATNGNLYGTTLDGGAHGGGTIFEIKLN